MDRQLLNSKRSYINCVLQLYAMEAVSEPFGFSGQETMALFRNAIWMNIDMQLKLRLDLHSPENVELP